MRQPREGELEPLPLMIYPEGWPFHGEQPPWAFHTYRFAQSRLHIALGTTTNGQFLARFKRGAFTSGVPVQRTCSAARL
jgi:hypothetical protein